MNELHYLHFTADNENFGVSVDFMEEEREIDMNCREIIRLWWCERRHPFKTVDYKEVCGAKVVSKISSQPIFKEIKANEPKAVRFYPSTRTGIGYSYRVSYSYSCVEYDYTVNGIDYSATKSMKELTGETSDIFVVVYEVTHDDLLKIAAQGPMKFFR